MLSAANADCIRGAIDTHEEAMGLHRAAMRKHRAAAASLSDMLERAGVSDLEDDETQTIQTSDGPEVSDGSENGRDAAFRRRQADRLKLSVSH
jgi:hypothetical protein